MHLPTLIATDRFLQSLLKAKPAVAMNSINYALSERGFVFTTVCNHDFSI